jgi:hypothetical protein
LNRTFMRDQFSLVAPVSEWWLPQSWCKTPRQTPVDESALPPLGASRNKGWSLITSNPCLSFLLRCLNHPMTIVSIDQPQKSLKILGSCTVGSTIGSPWMMSYPCNLVTRGVSPMLWSMHSLPLPCIHPGRPWSMLLTSETSRTVTYKNNKIRKRKFVPPTPLFFKNRALPSLQNGLAIFPSHIHTFPPLPNWQLCSFLLYTCVFFKLQQILARN